MKFFSTFLFLSIFISGISSCKKRISGSGNSITEQRNIGNFSGLESNGSFDVLIVESSTTSLNITGEDNIISELETVVENGTLKIRFRKNLNVKHGDITMAILVALSYSGNVSDSCRSEWNFIKNNDPVIEEKMVTEEMNAKGYDSEKSVGKRLSDSDLIFPNFLFGL
ncbi:GIN domain-containing protein [Flavitalea sp.]|nr:DUF2807 domain-containing protein [Flavitalea sp.]